MTRPAGGWLQFESTNPPSGRVEADAQPTLPPNYRLKVASRTHAVRLVSKDFRPSDGKDCSTSNDFLTLKMTLDYVTPVVAITPKTGKSNVSVWGSHLDWVIRI